MEARADPLPAPRPVPAAAAPGAVAAVAAVGLWAALIVVAHVWGQSLNDSGARILLNAPPLFGEFDLRLGPAALAPAIVAAAAIAATPRVLRAPWPVLLALAVLAALAWAAALALATSPDGLTAPLEGPSDYLADVPPAVSPGEYLSTFTERIDGFATHVRSHPPGMVLALWGLDSLGLGGSTAAAILVLAVALSAIPAALLALRGVAGEVAARRAAPFLALAPAAVWIATTADALYMGVGAWAVALTVLALGAEGRRSWLLAGGGGLAFGLCMFLSYGLVLLAAIPLGVAIARRRIAPLAVAAGGALAVVAAFAAAGFWWLDGFAASREQYQGSIARSRPYGFFLAANLAAFALALGPAVAAGLATLRDRRVWLLAGGALVAVALADLSGMSKAEVERIWLPFLPWVALATAAIAAPRPRAALLAAGAVVAIAIQLGVETIW